ncbi:MAG: cytochrome C [Marinosulfonomonas sp.]|nr:MAG: cytochrome C [Marinosulfonomonas sp.]
MKPKKILIGAIVVSAIAATAFAHGGATGIVKERMDGMSALGKAIKALAPMMRGEGTYDAEAVRQGAQTIRAHAGASMTKLFPTGSGGMPSEAKETVWQDWQEFSALAEQLHLYSEGLSLAADNGLMMSQDTQANTGSMMGGSSTMMGGTAPMMASTMALEELSEMSADGVFAMVSQTCSACHTKFRAEAK